MAVYRLKGTAGPVTNQSWSLEGEVVIGSDPQATIHVESEAFASQHAALVVEDNQIRLKLLENSEGLFLNGSAIEEAMLSSGDEIRIGNCRWMLQAPGLRPDKVLTDDAVRQRRGWIPWLVAGGLIGLGALAWWLDYLPF